jgi:hypothetical protein
MTDSHGWCESSGLRVGRNEVKKLNKARGGFVVAVHPQRILRRLLKQVERFQPAFGLAVVAG